MVNLVFVNYFLINTLDLGSYVVPLDAVHLIVSATRSKLRDGRILKEAVDCV